MSLTGNIALDFLIILALDVIVGVGGTLTIFFIIAFIYAKIEEFFE